MDEITAAFLRLADVNIPNVGSLSDFVGSLYGCGPAFSMAHTVHTISINGKLSIIGSDREPVESPLRSVRGWISVSVIAPTAILADALSTAIAVAPKDAAEAILTAGVRIPSDPDHCFRMIATTDSD